MKLTHLLTLAAVLMATPVLAQNDQREPMQREYAMLIGSKAIDSLAKQSGSDFTIAFLSQMVKHHQGAIKMAQEALQIATHDETRREARKIIRHERKQIGLMTSWLQDWYNTNPTQWHMNVMRLDIQPMLNRDITSDRMFFEMMIPHHRYAIELSQMALDKGDRAAVRSLARRIVREMENDIARYQRLITHVSK